MVRCPDLEKTSGGEGMVEGENNQDADKNQQGWQKKVSEINIEQIAQECKNPNNDKYPTKDELCLITHAYLLELCLNLLYSR